MSDFRYTVRSNRILHSCMEGMELLEDRGTAARVKAVDGLCCGIFFMPFDGGKDGSDWGRLKFSCKKGENTIFVIYTAASDRFFDPKEFSLYKAKLFMQDSLHAGSRADENDLLLYDLSGRYLYVLLEVKSPDRIEFEFSDFVIDQVGDDFMATFPEIYRERNSFFHRYMSVLSSTYNDLGDRIRNLPAMLDLDTCPAGLLPVYAGWLGIDLGDNVFDEKTVRTLVREGYHLNRIKGTRACLERISEILLGEPGIIIERNSLSEFFTQEQVREYDRIYGCSRYDVTLLLKKDITAAQRSQMQFLLEQFMPVRTRLHMIELGQVGGLDSPLYLDINAAIFAPESGNLDGTASMDENIILQ